MIFNLLKKTQYRDATDCVSNIINHCRVETHSMRLYHNQSFSCRDAFNASLQKEQECRIISRHRIHPLSIWQRYSQYNRQLHSILQCCEQYGHDNGLANQTKCHFSERMKSLPF